MVRSFHKPPAETRFKK